MLVCQSKKLSNWYSSIDANALDAVFSDDGQSAWTIAETCYFAMYPDNDAERKEAENFWSQFGSDHPSADYVRGFERSR